MKWKPKVGEIYFTPYLVFWEVDCVALEWFGYSREQDWYEAGIVCRTKTEALELAEKMLAVAKERVQND